MTTLNIPKPAYRIETKRLVLRCWEPKDAAMIQEATAANKEHLLPFMPWAADEPQTIEQKVELTRRFRGWSNGAEVLVYALFDQGELRALAGPGLPTRLAVKAL